MAIACVVYEDIDGPGLTLGLLNDFRNRRVVGDIEHDRKRAFRCPEGLRILWMAHGAYNSMTGCESASSECAAEARTDPGD